MALKFITADEAAALVQHNDNVGFSGFTPAGCPKVVPGAIAKRAEAEHAAGRPFKIGMFTGASTGDRLDGALARAEAVKFRTPYQSNKDMRTGINAGTNPYFDMHLSMVAQELRYGFLGKVDVAIVEAADVTEDGEIVPTSGVGILPTICRLADKIIVELNDKHPKEIRGIHDIVEPLDPPHRKDMPVYHPSDRVGQPFVKVDPAKIVGVVRTSEPNDEGGFAPLDEVTQAIGNNVAKFLIAEMEAGRLPKEFLPLQSGVGNVANAVLGALGDNEQIPAFEVYTEVIQDAVIALMKKGRVKFASGCSLSVSRSVIQDIYGNLDFFKDKLLLRPQEYSNNPETARSRPSSPWSRTSTTASTRSRSSSPSTGWLTCAARIPASVPRRSSTTACTPTTATCCVSTSSSASRATRLRRWTAASPSTWRLQPRAICVM